MLMQMLMGDKGIEKVKRWCNDFFAFFSFANDFLTTNNQFDMFLSESNKSIDDNR